MQCNGTINQIIPLNNITIFYNNNMTTEMALLTHFRSCNLYFK